MASFGQILGLGRSLAIYYAQPGRYRRARRFYGVFLQPGDLAFDIGAHVGNRTRAMHAAGAKVVAVEPQPLLFAFLRRTMPAGVELCPQAVGAQEGEADLLISERHPTVSSIAGDWIETVGKSSGFRHVRWNARHHVSVTTLDALIREHGLPYYCKIDVEGAELSVLEGLSAAIPMISFEHLPEARDRAAACITRLTQLGDYRFNYIAGEDFSFAAPDWVNADAIIARLDACKAEGRPGDVYARLETRT